MSASFSEGTFVNHGQEAEEWHMCDVLEPQGEKKIERETKISHIPAYSILNISMLDTL